MVHVPRVVVTVGTLMPVDSLMLAVTPAASLGPRFVAVYVYVRALPASADVGPFTVTATSACAWIVVLDTPVLSLEFGSG